MARPYRVRAAFLMAILLAVVAGDDRHISAQDASPNATPASGCGVAPAAGTPVASPVATAAPTLLTSPERLVWAGGPHAVILLHQINLDMRSWTPQAESLNAAGHTVVAIARAGPRGLLLAIDDLRTSCGVTTVTVIGASIGGNIAQDALRIEPDAFDSVILLSSVVDVPLFDVMPKLFVASEDEGMSYDPVAQAESSAGDDNSAVIYPGTAHAQDIFATDNGADLLGQILSWLVAHT